MSVTHGLAPRPDDHGPFTAFVSTTIAEKTRHTDPDCDWAEEAPARTGVAAPNLAAHAQYAAGRTPCIGCALSAVLDHVGAHTSGPGYHYVACAGTHWEDWLNGDFPDRLVDGVAVCFRCDALTRYARERYLPATTAHRAAMFLRAGTLRGPQPILNCLLVASDNTTGTALPVVTAPLWVAAAPLIRGSGLTLPDALHVAAGMYAPPGAT